MLDAIKYVDHLYSNDLDGYVQVLQLKNNEVVRLKNTQYKGIKDVILEQQGQADSYLTPNSFYKPERASDNIRHFRALYIDVDLVDYEKVEALYQVYMRAAKGEIPKPTMIISSGRGLHFYWRIKHAPKQASYTWQELEDYLYKHLKPLGADLRATDSARLLRIPGTINSKNGETCEVLELNDTMYSMYELRDKYLNYKPKQLSINDMQQPKSKGKINHLFNSYSLHVARAQDIETLCRLRSYQVEGYRNSIIHCYSYWKGVTVRDPEVLEDITSKLNNKFVSPLHQRLIKSVVKSTQKAVEKFIDYEQGIRSGEDKRVTKGMRDKAGYWYTNDRLIEMLNITDKEQMHLKTIISSREKNRRKTLKEYESRRNGNGLTVREQAKADNLEKARKLQQEGLTQLEIAESLGVTQGYISQLLKDKI